MCVKHYHALIPQLDIIKSQWGVKTKDNLSHDKKQKSQGTLEQQLSNQAKGPIKRNTSAHNYA
jgi:hypothetical protein